MPGRFNPNDYIDVQERINRFWSEHPDGAIDTDVTYTPDFDHIVITAKVYKHRDDARPSSSGIAGESKSGVGANQTSWHENGETSAIGRALANMGYATSLRDRPSKQEMRKVVRDEAGEIEDHRPAPPARDAPARATNAPRAPEPSGQAAQDVPMDRGRESAIQALHAALAKHGLDHSNAHDYFTMPERGYRSVTEVPTPEIVALMRAMANKPTPQVRAMFPGTDTQPRLTDAEAAPVSGGSAGRDRWTD